MRFKKALAFLCAMTLLCGCGSRGTNSSSKPSTSKSDSSKTDAADKTSPSNYNLTPSKPVYSYSDAESSLLRTTIKSLDNQEDCLAALNIPVEYSDFKDVPFDEVIKRYHALPAIDHTPKNGIADQLPIDADALYTRIKANTDTFFSKNAHGLSPLSDDDIRYCCDIICKTLNVELKREELATQLDDVDTLLANMHMINGNGTCNAAVTEDGNMLFCRTASNIMQDITGYDEAIDITVAHETEHILQKVNIPAAKTMGISTGYGFMAKWADLETQPLFDLWLVEAAAERLAVRLYDREPMTYSRQISALDTLTLISLLRGKDVLMLSRATQQPSLEHVFDLLGCETPDEQTEMLKMLYGFEILITAPDDFLNAYRKQNHLDESNQEAIEKLQQTALANAMSTANKLFYRAIAQRIATDGMTLEDLYFLVAGWDVNMQKLRASAPGQSKTLVSPMVNTNNQLFETLLTQIAPALNTDADTLRTLYHNYYENFPRNQRSILKPNDYTWDTHNVSGFAADSNTFCNHLFMLNSEYKGKSVIS